MPGWTPPKPTKPGAKPSRGAGGWTPPAPKAAKSKPAARAGLDPEAVAAYSARRRKSIGGQLEEVVAGVPRGLVGAVRDTGVEAINTAKRVASPLPGVDAPKRRKGESFAQFYRRTQPLTGSLVESAGRTGGRLAELGASLAPGGRKPGDTAYGKAVDEGRIVGTLLEDLANVGAGSVLGSRLAGRAGLRRTAKVLDAPAAAARVARDRAGQASAGTARRAGTSEGRTGELLRFARLDPDSRQLRREAIEPALEKVSAGTGQAVTRGRAVAKVLPDLDEQRAATLVAEGEAPALAALRRHLDPAAFEAYRERTFGDAVPARAAQLAADLADDAAPELRARVDQALALGRDLPGGRTDRSAAYLAGRPDRAPQTGFDPLPAVVEPQLAPIRRQLPKADRLAAGARAKADRAAGELDQLRATSGAPSAPAGATAALEDAAMRVQRARDALAKAQAKAGAAENAVFARAEEAAARSARQSLRTEIRNYRRLAVAEARRQAGDLEASLVDEGRPAAPLAQLASGVPSPMRDVADQLRQGLGPKWAAMKLFAPRRDGVALDVWLERWNARHGVVDQITSGADYAAVAADVIERLGGARELRSAAAGLIGRGAEGRALSRLVRNEGDELYLAGTLDDAVARLESEAPRAAGDAGAAAVGGAFERIDRAGAGEDLALTPAERAMARAEQLGRDITGPEGRLAEARGAAVGKLLAAGERAGLTRGTVLGRAEQRARVTENVARSAEARRGSLSGQLATTRRNAEYSLEAAPARLRPVLQRNRQAVSLLTEQENRLRRAGDHEAARLVGKEADQLPTTLGRLKAAGVDFEHFTHVKLEDRPTSAGPRPGALPKVRKGREERQRTGSTTYDRTVAAQARAEIDAVKIAVAREAVGAIKAMPFVRRFDSIEAARAEGYVAWDPASPFEVSGQLNANTVFVPQSLFEGFRNYFVDPRWDKALRRTWDPVTQVFKIAVLPLSPSWQVGNVIGNTLLATIAGGVSPLGLIREGRAAVKAYRASGPRGERTFEAVGPRRLYAAGPTHEEFDFLRAPDEAVLGGGRASQVAGTITKPLMAVARKSYRLNGFVDDFGRSIVYLDKVRKGAAPDQALRQALSAMGDFSRMTPFERRVVRRIVPFYAWQRHLTQLAFRLPLEHPLRAVWVLHLADHYGAGLDDELPAWLAGSLPIGDSLLGTRGLNPFAAVGGPVLSPGDAARNLHPAIKLAAANLPGSPGRGINAYTGRPYTRPRGTERLDDQGRPLPTAPSVLKQITDISPQKRLVEALQGRGSIVRYESGDPVLTAEGPIAADDRTPTRGLLRFLGFPLTDRAAALEAVEREAGRREQAEKDRQRNEERKALLKAFPKRRAS